MQLGTSLRGRVKQLVGSGGGVAAYYSGGTQRVVLVWAWLIDQEVVVGLVEDQSSIVNAETVQGFERYGPVRFDREPKT